MTIEEFKEILADLFRTSVKSETKATITFVINYRKEYELKLPVKDFKNAVEKLQGLEVHGETELFDKHNYEIALGFDTFRPSIFAMRDSEDVVKEDKTSGVKYVLGRPSNEYLIYILQYLHKTSKTEKRQRPLLFMHHRIDRLVDQKKIPGLLDVIKELIPRFYTLKISSAQALKRIDFENHTFGLLFNLSYNLDTSLSPLRFLEEVSRSIRIRRIRRSSIEEIEPPKRVYINDLILHYQKGISSESIDHQYLSFYHVIEHFFEKVYNEDMLIEIRSQLTLPSFSHKKDKDIKGLIQVIQKRLKYRNEEFLINEPEALKLTLIKFIKVEELKSELFQFDETLLEYFRLNEVQFSGGSKINFDSPDHDEVIKNLANRIYKTRNSIVHSKEGDKTKFTPFRDDKLLLREIHLMRIISEKIIINSSIITQ